MKQCGFSKKCFHRVSGSQWEDIYRKIADKFADKTKTWKNGLHWANINGYSPKSMEKLVGCYPVDYSSWFKHLPEITDDREAYFLIEKTGSVHLNEKFWVFESCIPELIKALDLLNKTAFLNNGWLDYYIVSKKFHWIIGFNHHDIISCVGDGLDLSCFEKKQNKYKR